MDNLTLRSTAPDAVLRTEPLLVASDLTKRYGAVRALDGASFSCMPGEVLALVGENGAGKSTVSRILAGATEATSGGITLDGEPFDVTSIAEARERGVACAFQELALVPDWTVAENLMLPERRGRGMFSQRKAREQAEELLARLDVTHLDPSSVVGDLRLADRQVIEIVRAIAADPKLLILDEASSALSPTGVSWLFARIRELTVQGVGVIYVSHRLGEISEIADRGTVLRDGASVGEFTRGSWSEDDLVSQMAGRTARRHFPDRPDAPAADAPLALEVRGLRSEALTGVDLTAHRGEIVGIGGLQGQGQTELLRCLFGATPALAEEWTIGGRPARHLTPTRAVRRGVGFVPEDRKTEGLALTLSVGENLLAPWLRPIAPGGPVQLRRERSWVDRVLGSLSVRTRGPNEAVGALSGGNQQKVVFGRWIDRNRSVLLLHDPTRGIDVRAKQELYAAMLELAKSGVAIIWFSTEVEELVHLCHRVAVLYRGRVARVLEGDQITPDAIVGAAVGTA
ncbi:ribose transport system ATP-binding protein [Agromyces flavus]|uniref:Monosaccharide ABC transporter ATP-binding protein, CUT2 family n=1 Tax=Agromyces flavus TaxID=589382 RepID=A0A1H2A3J1_9MICO|nr:sugar ABC transporter ATP-binding protein [Agromyces flavus]MCP2367412.1 ribose transport system ATP-binding protein [Agromyces flavus]GGI45780.1 ribose import ATP-binding protein RbsA [Agromyces flavus]SDT40494.1 monosaccharide ABC transporter ATP-binding protein, CUT2 family [Agromyces flavus]